MQPLTERQRKRMREAAEATMWDTCRIRRRSAGETDAYGVPQGGWAETTSPCGFRLISLRESADGVGVSLVDAEVRLPYATQIGANDQVVLIARHGETLERMPLYEVVGEPVRGPSAIVARLRQIPP